MKGKGATSLGMARVFLVIAFIGMLAAPYFLGKKSGAESKTVQSASVTSTLEMFGFHLEDITEASGLRFEHKSPVLHESVFHILPQIAAMGASVSVVDFDKDGWNDLYLTNSKYGTKNALYRNQQDGTFMDVAVAMGVGDVNKEGTGVSMGAVWGDYDNDGYEDLFLYKWGKPELFHNLAGNGFEAVTAEAGFPDWVNSNASIWLDYNNDGLLDLFIGGYYKQEFDLWNLNTTVIMPESFEYANNGGRNFMFKNTGTGAFEDVTEQLGLTSTKWTLAAGSVDMNGDSYPDLVIANDYSVDEYYQNEQGKKFVEIGKEAGLGFAPKSGMNVSFGDVLNQSMFGIYISNITENGVLLQGNNLWMPQGDDRSKFTNMARARGVEMGGWSYGTQFGDLNNDGAIDIYLANGFISGIKGNSYWYDYSKITGGNKAIISDAANWPEMNGRSQSGYQENKIWLNNGEGIFAEVGSYMSGGKTFDSRAVALADLSNSGKLDVIVANQNDKAIIYGNTVTPEHHWVAFDLEGTKSNRSAIGAIVELHWAGKQQTQGVSGGIGFASQNQRRLHFGIGTHTEIEKALIYWPSGVKQVVEAVSVDEVNIVKEEI